ncbi:ABC transporter substrate binding protein, partial [Enterococcus faecalis]|uniref:ABC transporter substrate binding protein n=1 Tax=Enterococcus faecalis TaxID=1351 RepID=UPI003CC6D827
GEEGFQENGYDNGKNLELIFQIGQADQSMLAIMRQQLVQKKADVLIGKATPAAQSLSNKNQEIPNILCAINDPVSSC